MNGKLIIYDATCPLCLRLKQLACTWGLVRATDCRAYGELEAQYQPQVDPLRFRNEMALIDLRGGACEYGISGLLSVFSARFPALGLVRRALRLDRMLALPYRILAQNRYVLATPPERLAIRCDCRPPLDFPARLMFISLVLLFALVTTALFGAALQSYFPALTPLQTAGIALLACGSGWLISGLTALLRMRREAWEYLGHWAGLMLRGVLVLWPYLVIHALAGPNHPLLALAFILPSSTIMYRQHVLRARYLRISRGWTALWTAALAAGFTLSILWAVLFYTS